MTNHQQAFGDLLWRRIVIVLPYLWLILFFLVPFAIVFKISFSDPIVAQPPFTPLFDQSQSFLNWFQGSLNNYLFLLEDNLYWVSYLRSIKVAFISTICCLLLGYPMAYYIAQSAPTKRNVLLMLIILPFWTSFLLRVYAWMGILSTNGIINSVFLWIGVIDEPIQMLYTNFAVYLGIVYTYLPFMILPLYANLERLDLNLHDAAADLGGKPLQVFWDITLPVSLPGVIAGSLLVFIPAMGEFVIPALLGGLDSLMIGRTLYDEFFVNRDWPLASAVASILLLILVVPMVLFQRNQAKSAEETS
ncbi:MAG: ABC transporter permease subunit [Pseudomonadota bacterium]|nr:ABC transporter permease subunit [Pseudomonadota bacterium]MEE3300339.1 ABC transporter permease subunit [Pseudomonadota bacterium]